ncbi:MAG: glycosyltransferase family 4 protein [Pseudomonadota bacterium]
MIPDVVRHSLHRCVWQHLPRAWRREALFHVTALTAPRPSAQAKPAPPFLVVGALRTASGLGESARLCYHALKASAMQTCGLDITAELMQPIDCPDFRFADGRDVEGPGTLILHVNAPLVPFALSRLGRRRIRDKYIIGYWAWELPNVPSDWRHGIPFVHEIWVPSAFTADAVRPMAGGRPVRVIPHPVAVQGASAALRLPRPDRPFTVLLVFNMASSFARKNPLASIRAFRRAFGDDPSCRLIVKTVNGREFPDGIRSITDAIGAARNIAVVDRAMTADEIAALYDDSDAVISLHRSEGFGLTLAEAMLRRVPVVATDWSGNVDFLNVGNALPIPCRLVPAEDPQGTYHHPDMMWAEADVDAAADALRRLRRDPELARRLGEAGARDAARSWSAYGYADAVRRHLGLQGSGADA